MEISERTYAYSRDCSEHRSAVLTLLIIFLEGPVTVSHYFGGLIYSVEELVLRKESAPNPIVRVIEP